MTNQKGVYGYPGVSSPYYVPGARYLALGWVDSSAQEFWLFGGFGFGALENEPGT